MAMGWNELAQRLVGLGAPVLGAALGGPLGGAAGQVLAQALGASEPTPQAVERTLALQDNAAPAVEQAESAWVAELARLAEVQVAQVGETQRAEITSDDRLQRSWRPLYALELSLVECPGFALTLLHALWTGHDSGINGFAALSGLLIAYFGARFGVLGVYVSGRTREKQASSTGLPPDSLAGAVLKAIVKKK